MVRGDLTASVRMRLSHATPGKPRRWTDDSEDMVNGVNGGSSVRSKD